MDKGLFATEPKPEDRADGSLSGYGTTTLPGTAPSPAAPPSPADLLACLCTAVDAAAGGRGRLVLIRCEDEPAGRATLDALEDHVRAPSVRTLRARCEPDVDGSPLRPWATILPLVERDAQVQDANLVPRFARFAGLSRVLHNLTRASPGVVVLENLEHADRGSLLLLEWLASQLSPWRLALIATYREPRSATHALRETLVELRRDPHSLWLTVGRQEARVEAERAVFRRDGEYWTIAFEDRVVRLRDNKGLRILATLLARPGEFAHVSTLALGPSRRRPGAASVNQRAHERARVAATKNIKTALDRIAAADPSLGRYLNTTVRRGYHCGYVPDPDRPTSGSFDVRGGGEDVGIAAPDVQVRLARDDARAPSVHSRPEDRSGRGLLDVPRFVIQLPADARPTPREDTPRHRERRLCSVV